MIEIDQPQEFTQFPLGCGFGKFMDYSDLLLQWGDAMSVDTVPEEF